VPLGKNHFHRKKKSRREAAGLEKILGWLKEWHTMANAKNPLRRAITIIWDIFFFMGEETNLEQINPFHTPGIGKKLEFFIRHCHFWLNPYLRWACGDRTPAS